MRCVPDEGFRPYDLGASTLLPGEPAGLGASDPVAGARLELTSRRAVFPFVVAVDDRSGDATFVAASDLTPRP